MKRFYFTLTFATILFAINIVPAYAAGDDEEEDGSLVPISNYDGKGITLDDISFKDENDKETRFSERIMFYNIGNKKFLNAGGSWGTRAATYTSGLSVRLENPSGTGKTSNNRYYIQTPYWGQGTYIGCLDGGVYFDRNDGANEKTCELKEVKVSDIAQTIRDQYGIKDEDHIYKIQFPNKGKELLAGQYMQVNVFKNGNQNLVHYQSTSDTGYQEYTYWKIVNLDEIKNTMLTSTHIYATEPADLTFLIRAQNFNHRNKYNRNVNATQPDEKDKRGWFFDFPTANGNSTKINPYKTNFSESDFKIGTYPFNNEDHGEFKYGMFDCAEIRNRTDEGNTVEVKVTSGQRLWQEIPVTSPGWYRIDCQGFFYNGEDANENCCAKLFAYSDKTATEGTATSAYVNLLPKRYLQEYRREIKVDDVGSAFDRNLKLANLKAGHAPKTHLEAGVAFYTNEYPNSVLVYVSSASEKTPGAITFGIEATRDFEDNDVVWVDNFNIKYLGQSFALDERKTYTSPLTDKNNEPVKYENRPLVLRRTLNKGVWNPIVLPVNLTKAQVNTTFFPLPFIAEFKGFKDDHTLLFQIIDLTDLNEFKDEKTVAMKAGHCYLIKSGYEGHSGTIQIGDEAGKTMKGPYYVVDRVTYDVETDIDTYIDTPTNGKDCVLSIKGVYKPTWIPLNSFFMDNSTLWHNTNKEYMARGYSWWIEDAHQKENATQAHSFSFSAMNSEYDEVTGLYEVKIGEENHSHNNSKIYNLQGIEMNGNAALPKGIYISNGKKFIVK